MFSHKYLSSFLGRDLPSLVACCSTVLAIAGCASVSRTSTAVTPAGVARPNVIVIFDDQLRADVCGIYGGRNITTPNIDRLASQGVTFTNAFSRIGRRRFVRRHNTCVTHFILLPNYQPGLPVHNTSDPTAGVP